MPGAGSFETACAMHLREHTVKQCSGRVKLGVLAYAEALLIIPKTLAENSGFDVQESIIKLTEEREKNGLKVGLDCNR